jgi:hypothetical protein
VKFITRSLLVLLLLYGIVFAVADAYLLHSGASIWLAISFPIIWVGIQYLIGPWLIELFLDIDYGAELPARNRQFVEKLCMERGLKIPRIGTSGL